MINNFRAKLNDKSVKQVKVAYFGGSITQGAGSSKWAETSYRAIVTKWLRETYKDKEIIEIDASRGGTGSDFGVYRMNTEVTSKNPDLIIIEFCTNDSVLKNCTKYEEAMIQNFRRDLPECDLVMVETITDAMYSKLLKMETIESVDSYEKLSHKYGIDLVNVGKEFTRRIQAGEGDFLTYTNEGVHPNDLGHRIYADKVISYLKNVLSEEGENLYLSAHLVPVKDIDCGSFDYSSDSFYLDIGHAYAEEKDKKIVFEFEGTSIGVVFHFCRDAGKYKYRIDDGEFTEGNCFDDYCLRFNRVGYVMLSRNLNPGKHRLEIAALGEKSEESLGTKVKIATFLVS